MRVAVNSHALPFNKKTRIVSLLCIFETTINCESPNILNFFPSVYLSNVHKIGGVDLQCLYNHYAKFEYKRMKTVGSYR